MRNFGFEQRQDSSDTVRTPAAAMSPAMPPLHHPAPVERKIAVLGATLRFKGELSAEEDFILQGRIEGSITHTQSVTIGTEGSVAGNINARVIVIDGTVEGDLHGGESVVVNATGRVTGNIFAPRVGLIEGSFFNGRIDMGEARAASARAPARPRVENPGVPLSAEETEQMLAMKRGL
jgi:cytoskeletal protein CcmA (bactofilin family)